MMYNHNMLLFQQVVHDGEKLRPVVGGFSLEQPESQREKEQKFNMEGDFKFVLYVCYQCNFYMCMHFVTVQLC